MVVVEGKINVVIVLYSFTNVHEAVLKKKNLESRVDVVVDAKIYISMRRWSRRRENNKIVEEEEGINKLKRRREDIKIVKEGIKKMRREKNKIGEARMKS